jgi:hypothetical protein
VFEENLGTILAVLNMGKLNVSTPIDLTAPWFPTQLSSQISAIEPKDPSARMTLDEAAARTARLEHTIRVMTHWIPVMLVSFVETYLVDVHVELAAVDTTLVEASEQTVTLADTVAFSTLDELRAELRGRWAKAFVNDGGPRIWLTRLTARGVRFDSNQLPEVLEQLWGTRHLVVHNAGRVTREFMLRHPTLSGTVGVPLRISIDRIARWINTASDFVGSVDASYAGRIEAKSVRQEVTSAAYPTAAEVSS